MNDTQKNFRRGGLETLIAAIVLIVIVVGGLVYVAYYYGSVVGGASQQVNVQLQGSTIKVNAVDGTGSVYLKIYNQGPGGARLLNVTITGKDSSRIYSLCFGASNAVYVNAGSAPSCSSGTAQVGVVPSIAGTAGTGTAWLSGSTYFLNLPVGTTVTILLTHTTAFNPGFPAGLTPYFDPGAQYKMVLLFVQAPQIETTIPSVSSP